VELVLLAPGHIVCFRARSTVVCRPAWCQRASLKSGRVSVIAIRHSRGLGSVGGAVSVALAAVQWSFSHKRVSHPLTKPSLIQLSSEFEGHPDNAPPRAKFRRRVVFVTDAQLCTAGRFSAVAGGYIRTFISSPPFPQQRFVDGRGAVCCSLAGSATRKPFQCPAPQRWL